MFASSNDLMRMNTLQCDDNVDKKSWRDNEVNLLEKFLVANIVVKMAPLI